MNRENAPYYITSTSQEQQEMLEVIGLKKLDDLYSHIDDSLKFQKPISMPTSLNQEEIKKDLEIIASKNNVMTSFVADALAVGTTTPLIKKICSIRGLTTAYTPYQPERSQGTLQTLWLYQSLIAELTGFEAINASLYDRGSAHFEALLTALRLTTKKNQKILLASSLFPQDIAVIKTNCAQLNIDLVLVDIDKNDGTISKNALLSINTGDCCAFIFPQINQFGILEDVDFLTDFCSQNNLISIASVDLAHISSGCMKPPREFGTNEVGVNMFIAEGQHLALAPNFGGPGIGIMGIRYHAEDKQSIRQTPGRYIGKSKDLFGRECKSLILSTREQHIRRDKATSNICSNQSFIASIVAASLLNNGAKGLEQNWFQMRKLTQRSIELFTSYQEFSLTYPHSPIVNEFCLTSTVEISDLFSKAIQAGIDLGICMEERTGIKNTFKFSISINHSSDKLSLLESFLKKHFTYQKSNTVTQDIPSAFMRKSSCDFPAFDEKTIFDYFSELGEQNLSPDDAPYPLGSCTMKYNPYINDWAASLLGFTQLHPQTHYLNAQGSLEILFKIQEYFKAITGLAGVTTQPLAGAQGELVGLKLFQAYHRHNNNEQKNIILIPKSAHGTNPASAAVAGYTIVEIGSQEDGQINMDHLQELIQKHSGFIAGIMITNPNTSGVFENNFKMIADYIHEVQGLVYMDGANMNAIAGIVDLGKLGVDAVHNNLHKTWSIPHGGGGPGDAIVAVSEKLVPFLPGIQVIKKDNIYYPEKATHSIGEFHRHFGNFAHKVRCYTYLRSLGSDGIPLMSSVAVLSARYLFTKISEHFPTLPANQANPRMHEFIITLSDELFAHIQKIGLNKAQIIPRIGKLFLDFGIHAPTVAFPEAFGLMIEPTESFTKKELDHFVEVLIAIKDLIENNPEVLLTVPHFTPIDRVDELEANKNPILSEKIRSLSPILKDRFSFKKLLSLSPIEIKAMIIHAHSQSKAIK